MLYLYNNKIFNYINYFTIACIIPIGYFAPLGEWLLLSLISIVTLLSFPIKKNKTNYNCFLIFISSILVILFSYYWTINSDRTLEVIGPISGIIFAIYILLSITSTNKIKNMDNLIGIPMILTSICIFLDLFFNSEIRSNLAILAGDQPTSESGNYSRGIIILTIMMPLSVAMYLNEKKYNLAIVIFTLATVVIILGPNNSSKIALICALLSSLLIYFFGPRAFLCFGILSITIILFLPVLSTKVFPVITNIDKNNSYYMPWQSMPAGGSVIHRLLVWEYVGSEIYKKPLLGHGVGTSRLIGQNIILNAPNSDIEIKGGIPLHPHNNFLQIWLELGIVGIIIITLIWIKVIKFGIRIRKNSYILGTGICSSIVTIFVICNLSFGVFQAWWMSIIAFLFLISFQSSKYEK
jgi:O-antigen ligase